MVEKESTIEENKIKEELKPKINIVKEVSILYDGKQYMIKIPKEISDFYKIEKGNKIKFTIKPISKGKGENSFEIIK